MLRKYKIDWTKIHPSRNSIQLHKYEKYEAWKKEKNEKKIVKQYRIYCHINPIQDHNFVTENIENYLSSKITSKLFKGANKELQTF